jgi:hypothetical protein
VAIPSGGGPALTGFKGVVGVLDFEAMAEGVLDDALLFPDTVDLVDND